MPFKTPLQIFRLMPVLLAFGMGGCAWFAAPEEPEIVEPEPIVAEPVETESQVNARLIINFSVEGLTAMETERGVLVTLASSFFEFASADLNLEARDKLRFIARTLNNDDVSLRHIAIEGHTDSLGDPAFNTDLSKRRAESVADELIFSQVAADRLDIGWFGSELPIAPNKLDNGRDNPEGRARNRRVELIIKNSQTQTDSANAESL